MIDKEDLVFREVQKFSLWICRLPLVLVMVLTTGIMVYAIGDMMHERNPPSVFVLIILGIIGIGVPILVAFLFLLVRLETEVRSDGLYVRFFPIHIRYKKFTAEDLSQYYARTYRPLVEYGGWGIRYGFGKSGRAYNVSGNKGLQLVLKNGRRLLIGSQRPDELAEAISSFMDGS